MEHSKGMTLAEVIIGSFLLILLTGLVVAFLVPSLRAQVKGTMQVELQQQAAVTLRSLASDLVQSAPRAISLRNLNPTAPAEQYPPGYSTADPVLLALVRTRDVLEDGQVAWEESPVVYLFHRERGEVLRRTWKSPPALSVILSPTAPMRLPDSDLSALATSPTGVDRRLAREVTYFDVSHSLGRGYPVGELVTVTIILERRERCRLSTEVLLRN